LLARNYLSTGSQTPQQTIAAGMKLPLKDVRWQESGKTIVLALSTTCHYCTESAGFYKELVKQCKLQHVHTLAVLPQPLNESGSYLAATGVLVDEIRQSSMSDMQVAGTPTLILINSEGVVKNVWRGKLNAAGEKEVLGKLGS